MNDLLKKMFFSGLGLAVLTKLKMKEFSKEYANICKKSEIEGEKFYKDLLNEAEKASKEIENKIKSYAEEVFKRLNIATLERVTQLEKRIADLEAKLAEKD